MANPSSEFSWQHDFPPFYTLQPNADTRTKQLSAWRSIVVEYCKKHKLTKFDVRKINDSELFNNKVNKCVTLYTSLSIE